MLKVLPAVLLSVSLLLPAIGARAAETPTIQACVLSQPACRPGYGITAGFRWLAQPVAVEYQPFVHILNAAGNMVFQADHKLAVPTTRWSGAVAQDVFLDVPHDLPAGEYAVIAGLWSAGSNTRLPLTAGAGVTPAQENSFRVATFQVSPEAPLPKLPPPTLDLSKFRLTFDEDFTAPLSVSARGPGTRWTAHMPDAPDFGDGKFADPEPGFPFTVEKGVLRIEARKKDGQWRSGLLASVDQQGRGFTQKYGYFEMRAKLPKGEGVWPAFWVMKQPTPDARAGTRIEIDVMEQFGARPNTLSSSIHFWGPGQEHRVENHGLAVSGLTDDFHNFGVLVDPDYLIFYLDGAEHWRVKTPEEARVPLYLLVDLALGSGWPTERTPDPSSLFVDYIRAYAPR